MHINPATFQYADRWDASPEEDERFIGLSKIMTAICDALEMTEGRGRCPSALRGDGAVGLPA